MNLYLLRHGEAVPPNGTITDGERMLTDHGRRDIESVGRLLSRLNPTVTRIITSPLQRAKETGEILSRALPSPPPVSQSENLFPGFRRTNLLKELSAMNDESVVAVGHQPDMTGLISYLISGPSLDLEMEPGALAALTIIKGAGKLRWLLSPALIRNLSGNL